MATYFGEALAYAVVISVKDLLKGNTSKVSMKLRSNYHEHKEKIADDGAAFIDIVSKMLTGVDRDSANTITEGMPMVPIYIFLKVFRLQMALPSKQQIQMLDLYFGSIDLKISKQDVLNSISGGNASYEQIEYLVGLSDYSLGSFWQELFKTICTSDSKDGIIAVIIRCVESIMTSFAFLGGQNHANFEDKCESFINIIYNQFDKVNRNYPNSQQKLT